MVAWRQGWNGVATGGDNSLQLRGRRDAPGKVADFQDRCDQGPEAQRRDADGGLAGSRFRPGDQDGRCRRQAKMSRGLSARRLAPSSVPIRSASRGRAVQAALQQERAVAARHQPGQVQFAVRQQPRVATDRRPARAVEPRQQGAFGCRDGLRLGVLDGGEQFEQFGIVGAHGDADDALAGGGHHRIGIQHHRGRARPSPAASGRHRRATRPRRRRRPACRAGSARCRAAWRSRDPGRACSNCAWRRMERCR